MTDLSDRIALIDLDGTVADYDSALKEQLELLRSPNEPPYQDRYTQLTNPASGGELPYMEARRKLITRQPGFWRNLKRLNLGFDVVNIARDLGFKLHVVTKGPHSNGPAWSEKLEWAREHLPDATVHISGDKSVFYGRVLIDDYSPYFMAWLAHRPRGLVVCVAHPWNQQFAVRGANEHPNIFRYDGSNKDQLQEKLTRAYSRESGEKL